MNTFQKQPLLISPCTNNPTKYCKVFKAQNIYIQAFLAKTN